jgi:hypothetical protein
MSRWARPRKEAPEPSCEFPNVETSLPILAKLETDNKLASKEALSRINTVETAWTRPMAESSSPPNFTTYWTDKELSKDETSSTDKPAPKRALPKTEI